MPRDDARDFAAALQKQKGGLYRDVEVRKLIDADATRASVLDALEWLSSSTTSRDIAIVLIAGHGLTDEKGRYWFLPADARPKHLGATAVCAGRLPPHARRARGQGGAVPRHLPRQRGGRGARPRPVGGSVDTASLVNDFAKAENGARHLRVLAGLGDIAGIAGLGPWRVHPGADRGRRRAARPTCCTRATITVSELDAYIVERVKQLTDGHQHPVMSRPATVPDFAFALTK